MDIAEQNRKLVVKDEKKLKSAEKKLKSIKKKYGKKSDQYKEQAKKVKAAKDQVSADQEKRDQSDIDAAEALANRGKNKFNNIVDWYGNEKSYYQSEGQLKTKRA